MKRNLLFAMGAAVALSLTPALAIGAQVTVLNFDDLTPLTFIPSNYGGVIWDGPGLWNVYSNSTAYTMHSAPNGVYFNGNDEGFDFATPTVVNGAWFSSYLYSTLVFQLYLGGSLEWTSSSLTGVQSAGAPPATPQYLATGYTGLVDRVVIHEEDFVDFWVMDDLSFGSEPVIPPDPTATPEPASLTLMATGLVGIVAAARRRRRAI